MRETPALMIKLAHRSPLVTCFHGGNHDIKFICNDVGAAEYAASYSGKQEAPDTTILQKLVAKKFATLRGQIDTSSAAGDHRHADRLRLKAVGNAMLESSQVGAVQACYVLLGLKFVEKDQTVEFINALERKKLNKTLLQPKKLVEADPTASATPTDSQLSTQSQLGRRDAYAKLVKQQRALTGDDGADQCNISFHAMLTHYTVCTEARSNTHKRTGPSTLGKLKEPPLIRLLDDGEINLDVALGELPHLKKFIIDKLVFTKRRHPAVIGLCPYIPVDDADDRSAYSTLLLHVPWPAAGESAILVGHDNVQEALEAAKTDDRVPQYAICSIDARRHSDDMFRNQGMPDTGSSPAEQVRIEIHAVALARWESKNRTSVDRSV